ncbi:MAG: hypothetical protein OEW00_05720, partial [candidate division Zixibacteria bacterium]|nr:hypothetical protein [candidate division Zixibacteria bacterium]
MSSDLELLLKLQVIDFDRGELERSKEYLPDMMENLTREIKEAKEKLENASKELAQARLAQKTLEVEIATREAELQKYQQQMMSIKTNKEYDALVAEIDVTKEGISNRETQLINTIDDIERLSKDIEEYQERYDKVAENNHQQLTILQEKIDSIGDKVAQKVRERQEITAAIPRATLSLYERVRRGKGGDVVVAVKRRACGAC